MFYWGFMLLWVMGLGFENMCTVSVKWNFSKIIPRLYWWVYKALTLPSLTVELNVVVMTAVLKQDDPRLNPMGNQYLIPVFNWDPSWRPCHWQSKFNYHYDRILICVEIIKILCVKNQWGGRQKTLFCSFLIFGSALTLCSLV